MPGSQKSGVIFSRTPVIREKSEYSSAVARPIRVVPHDASVRAHHELVLRILSSRSFARSERLSTLLKYVCEMTLKGCDADLNEQKIGQAVFGRSMDYDSSADGIVRTQASRLRHRLDLYFKEEGIEEPIRVIIPKGGYVPVFVPVPAVEEVSVLQEPRSHASVNLLSSEPLPIAKPRIGQIVPWFLCALLAIALAGVVIRQTNAAAGQVSMLHHPLWDQMFSPLHATLEVPGDSGLVMFHRFSTQAISLNDYLLGSFRSMHIDPEEHGASLDMANLRTDIGNRRYTSIVDLDAAVTLAQIAQSRHGVLQVRYARDLRPNDLKNGNIILLGAFEANPWIELFEPRMNFILDDNYRTHIFFVRNKSPLAGEPDRWESIASDPQRRVYGIVAYLPNLSDNGNALLIEGTAMAGTEAAWDFVSHDAKLLPFLKKIQRADGTIPHFELLLVTQNMGSSAVHSNLLSWRIAE